MVVVGGVIALLLSAFGAKELFWSAGFWRGRLLWRSPRLGRCRWGSRGGKLPLCKDNIFRDSVDVRRAHCDRSRGISIGAELGLDCA